ncbi:hypothetical protein P421_06355 [Heyndrickxia coagulans P38]|uniref:Uncharacterized protein n=1 Tax=Heyndrickxia coagulans TaxID=1398 RepID=A0A133KTV0_HEYCO|nr:hypothetical protein P421_06355 [Heyndrickxia coagulans P38]KWZ82935.1 hypothetical protein HMPREF3213_01419 [Heyndrickxia coagulans]
MLPGKEKHKNRKSRSGKPITRLSAFLNRKRTNRCQSIPARKTGAEPDTTDRRREMLKSQPD